MTGHEHEPSRSTIRISLVSLLLIAALAVTCDADGFTAIHQWACDLDEPLKARLGLPLDPLTGRHRVPSDKRLRTLLARVEPGALLETLGRYACHRLERAGMPKLPAHLAREREARRRAHGAAPPAARLHAYAADGKTLTGSGRDRRRRTHLIALVRHSDRRVTARAAVAGKSNETPALRDLLDTLDLDGALLTCDAAHTCRASAQKILESNGHYLLIVKPNQAALHATLAARFDGDHEQWADRAHHWTERGHGRIDERHLRVAPAEPGDFPGALQVTRTTRYRCDLQGNRLSKEIVFAVTSAPADLAGPRDLAAAQQNHWSCEARHHVLDTTFAEDHCQARTGHAPQNLSTLRDLAIHTQRAAGHANHAAARRHYTHHAEKVFDLYEL